VDINEKPAGVGNEPSKTDFSTGHEQVMIVSIYLVKLMPSIPL